MYGQDERSPAANACPPITWVWAHQRTGTLRTRILTIISVGITVGFLLGMGVSALLRAYFEGGDSGLETTFTALVALMVGVLITYVVKSIP